MFSIFIVYVLISWIYKQTEDTKNIETSFFKIREIHIRWGVGC